MSHRKRKNHDMTAREQTQNKKPKHTFRNFCIFACFLAFVFGCYWNQQQLQEQIAAVYQQTDEVESLIDAELEKQIDLKARQGYLKTDEYYMRMARTKFNLIQEGEHLYVFD